MPKVRIKEAFTLQRDDGSRQYFPVGEQEMSDEDANHWYTIANSEDAPAVMPPHGTLEYAQYMARHNARVRDAQDVETQLANEAANTARDKSRGVQRRPIVPMKNTHDADVAGAAVANTGAALREDAEDGNPPDAVKDMSELRPMPRTQGTKTLCRTRPVAARHLRLARRSVRRSRRLRMAVPAPNHTGYI